MVQLAEEPKDRLAWERFLELGVPTREWEAYRYVKLDALYSRPFCLAQEYLPQEKPDGVLVFVNGHFSEKLSTVAKPWVALELSSAYKTYGHFLNSRKSRMLQEEKDPFAALNAAYNNCGLFLYLPPHSVASSVLKIVHIVAAVDKPLLCSPRIHLFAGKGSQGSLLFSQTQDAPDIWTNSVIDLALEERATLSCAFLSRQHRAAHDFLNVRATLKKQSVLKSYALSNGSCATRQDYRVALQAEEASASLYGVWNVAGERQHHVHVHMEHAAPNCYSLQKFKGVLQDSARSSFEGKIYVQPQAQKTNAYQMNNNLLLSENAVAYAKPNLEIFADDVKASHGATVGQIDPEHLFYLTARGCSMELARTLLVEGFCNDIISQMQEFSIDGHEILR